MKKHECIIGLLHRADYSELVTLQELQVHIYWTKEYNDVVRDDLPRLLQEEWTLKDYADKRKTTNLHRFDFCPVCGKAVDWKAIKTFDNNNN